MRRWRSSCWGEDFGAKNADRNRIVQADIEGQCFEDLVDS